MRVLAVDWGQRRLGLAVSDPTGTVVRPLGVIELKEGEDPARRVAEVARREGAGLVVVGLPLSWDGRETRSSRMARAFGQRLARMGLRVRFWDEWGSTQEARGRDDLAAAVILSEFLEAFRFDKDKDSGGD